MRIFRKTRPVIEQESNRLVAMRMNIEAHEKNTRALEALTNAIAKIQPRNHAVPTYIQTSRGLVMNNPAYWTDEQIESD